MEGPPGEHQAAWRLRGGRGLALVGKSKQRKGRKRHGRPPAGKGFAAALAADAQTRRLSSVRQDLDTVAQARAMSAASNPPLVTFIIPTLGRPSLAHTMASLAVQTDRDWAAVVIGDGVQPDVQPSERIQVMRCEPQGSAGLVRNLGIEMCSFGSPWYAFVDDDDTLKPDYVEKLREESSKFPGEGAGCIVFRMFDPVVNTVLPPHELINPLDLAWGKVGLSFAVRSEWFDDEHGLRFIRENKHDPQGGLNNEDITMLLDLRDRHGCVIHISPHMTYCVKDQCPTPVQVDPVWSEGRTPKE